MIVSNDAWNKLKRNRIAIAGMLIIVMATITALFAYYIAPDHTPNANRMIVEIGGRKPGFQQQFIKIPRVNRPQTESQDMFGRLLSGEPDEYQYIPITSYQIKNNVIFVDKYVDEGVTEQLQYSTSIYKDGFHKKEHIDTLRFLLGTDTYGRDILSRLIVGTRVSMAVGLVAVIISIVIGIFLGALAGYFGKKIDAMVMWFVNVMWSIPTILLVFALTLLLGKGFWQVFIAIGLTMWVNVARLVRGQVMAVKQMDYIEAARALGYTDTRIIIKHILPNIIGPVIVIAAANFASAIVIEAGLSFLGVGVQPPQPSWGLMIKENYNFIITQNPALALAPGIAIMLLVLAFNLLGNAMRDALDVRS